ncbi:MAG: penicillin-binding transpeptidase domain-containing protein [Telluria sp.]
MVRLLIGGLVGALLLVPGAHAKEVCAVVAEASSGKVLVQRGDCERRVTPASTFKIALSLMGYDAGFLKDEHTPVLPFRPGFVDWRENWREPTDPAKWIRDSVVWYSQQVTFAIGQERFAAYTTRFGFGNADVSGLPATEGPDLAWINSSLQVSPLEQVTFLRRLVNRELGVSEHAYDLTGKITLFGQAPGGWIVHGKTGSGGGNCWYVGWATKEQQTLVFAHLLKKEDGDTSGLAVATRARDEILAELPR